MPRFAGDFTGKANLQTECAAAAIPPRNATPSEIVTSIEAVAAGLYVLSSEIIGRLLAGQKPLRHAAPDTPLDALSSREIEVLAMLGIRRGFVMV